MSEQVIERILGEPGSEALHIERIPGIHLPGPYPAMKMWRKNRNRYSDAIIVNFNVEGRADYKNYIPYSELEPNIFERIKSWVLGS
jgi:hypothetical protein